MPKLARIAAAALALTCALAVSGCDANEPEPSPEPTATDEPVFASEEEALAAATEAYAAYLQTSDSVTSGQSERFDEFSDVLSDEYTQVEVEGLREFRESGRYTQGASTFDSIRMQSDGSSLRKGDTLSTYLCSDISMVRVVDASGADVTPADRDNRLPLEVDFLIDEEATFGLLIDRNDVWSGENFC